MAHASINSASSTSCSVVDSSVVWLHSATFVDMTSFIFVEDFVLLPLAAQLHSSSNRLILSKSVIKSLASWMIFDISKCSFSVLTNALLSSSFLNFSIIVLIASAISIDVAFPVTLLYLNICLSNTLPKKSCTVTPASASKDGISRPISLV